MPLHPLYLALNLQVNPVLLNWAVPGADSPNFGTSAPVPARALSRLHGEHVSLFEQMGPLLGWCRVQGAILGKSGAYELNLLRHGLQDTGGPGSCTRSFHSFFWWARSASFSSWLIRSRVLGFRV